MGDFMGKIKSDPLLASPDLEVGKIEELARVHISTIPKDRYDRSGVAALVSLSDSSVDFGRTYNIPIKLLREIVRVYDEYNASSRP
jgi:hypothetical protein